MNLDTTFLVDVLRGHSDVADQLEAVDETGTPFVSAVTTMGLAEAIRVTDASDAEEVAVIELLAELTELAFDRDCGIRAGERNADLVSAGDPVDETGVMIAATALVHGYPAVTRNVSNFDRIEGLAVRSY